MEATYMDYLILINKENYFYKKGGVQCPSEDKSDICIGNDRKDRACKNCFEFKRAKTFISLNKCFNK